MVDGNLHQEDCKQKVAKPADEDVWHERWDFVVIEDATESPPLWDFKSSQKSVSLSSWWAKKQHETIEM